MKRPAHFPLLCFALSMTLIGNAQHDAGLVTKVLEQVEKALSDHNQLQYEAVMRFKYMESDTFEIRNFTIRYRSNPANPLYGYDWEVAEKFPDSTTYTWMALPSGLYVMYDGTKVMGHIPLPEVIELGSYPETLRNYFMLEENVSPFTSITGFPVTMVDSNNLYYFKRQTKDWASRMLVVNKENYLPVQYIATITSEVGLTQIQDVTFHYNDDSRTLTDNTFSPDYYIAIGFTIPPKRETEPQLSEEKIGLTPENMAYLLNYPFVSATGDTTLISSSQSAYIIIDFWYAGCWPCLSAMPKLNELAEHYADAGLIVLGINCFDKKSSKTLVSRMQSKGISFPLLFGEKELIEKLGIRAFPTYMIVTPDRNVEFIQGSIEDVKMMLKEILGK